MAIPQAAGAPAPLAPPPVVAKKQRMGSGKRLLVGLAVMLIVFVGGGIVLTRLIPSLTTSTARLGPGPYYLHFNCGGDSSCMADTDRSNFAVVGTRST